MLSSQNLIWVKNVKRSNGTAWAYMEFDVGDVFDLHFPDNDNWYLTNYSKPRVGDCILLYQTLNDGVANPGGSYITHIVTPINQTLEQDPLSTHPYKRLVLVVAKSPNGIYKPANWNFFKANRGQVCRIETLETTNGTQPAIEVTQSYFWNLFDDIDPTLDAFVRTTSEQLDEDILSAEEGRERQLLRLHKQRERSSELVALKKDEAAQNGKLHCEVCQFDFETTYPGVGQGFIECHHKTPIANGIRVTRLEDLALVCSNCHRMLHRKNPLRQYYSVEELTHLIQHQLR